MIDAYLKGERLIGEDFTDAQREQWYAEESAAYLNLAYNDEDAYPYHELNQACAFDRMNPYRTPITVVGIGSAHGQEFKQMVIEYLLLPDDRLIIVESDKRYWRSELTFTINGMTVYMPVTYVAPNADGSFPIEAGSVDVVTCFGVLHHIDKVSEALKNISRLLRPEGTALIREPITSMGDWRQPRAGLTKNERGIPLELFRDYIALSGMRIAEEHICGFAPLRKLVDRLAGRNIWSSYRLTRIDLALCTLYAATVGAERIKYHQTRFVDKLAPTNVFYNLRKV